MYGVKSNRFKLSWQSENLLRTRNVYIKVIEQDDRGTHPALTVFISSLVLEQTILENLKALSSKYNLLSL